MDLWISIPNSGGDYSIEDSKNKTVATGFSYSNAEKIIKMHNEYEKDEIPEDNRSYIDKILESYKFDLAPDADFSTVFHHLWTKSVGKPDYNKEEWTWVIRQLGLRKISI